MVAWWKPCKPSLVCMHWVNFCGAADHGLSLQLRGKAPRNMWPQSSLLLCNLRTDCAFFCAPAVLSGSVLPRHSQQNRTVTFFGSEALVEGGVKQFLIVKYLSVCMDVHMHGFATLWIIGRMSSPFLDAHKPRLLTTTQSWSESLSQTSNYSAHN